MGRTSVWGRAASSCGAARFPWMQVTVKLFGSLREGAEEGGLSLQVDEGTSVGALRDRLAQRFEGFALLGDRIANSVNFELVDPEHRLADGDEVAFLPPVAGGVGACTLSSEPLQESEVAARVAGPDTGGVVTFVGAVRNHARGHSIKHIEYEAYPEMVIREMDKIATEVSRRWEGTRVAIAHRIGHLEVGDAAVIIVAASAHRAEAFEACRYTIDTLKQTVPIWKKEFTTEGHYWVDDRA